jgi:acetyltransferase
MKNQLSYFFSPAGVAVIGASSNPNKLSYGIFKNLTQYNYQGKIYPVNPKADEILGLKCFPDIASVPDPVELAVIVLPAPLVPRILEDCGKRGIKAVTIISGGFKEVGEAGTNLEQECIDIARQYGMRLIGPNCVGTIDLYSELNTTFIEGMPERGGIGFLSQSGAICGGIVNLVLDKKVGFSHFISMGNEADVTEADIIEYLGEDPNVRVIAAYVEGIKDGQHFIEVAKKVTRKKPIVLLKAGRTNAGARAVSSHTGSIAGAHAAYQTAFNQSGIIEVNTVAELFDVAMSLDFQPLPKGKRTVLLTNSGGPAALTSDSLAFNDLVLEDLQPETEKVLREHLNPSAQVANPVDMLGGAEPHEYEIALKQLLVDDSVDSIITILVPQALVNPADVAQVIVDTAKNATKPVFTCFMADNLVVEARNILHGNRIPMFVYPESVGTVLGAMIEYGDWLKKEVKSPETLQNVNNEAAKSIIAAANGNLGEADTRPLLEAYGIPVIGGGTAKTADEAVAIANKIGYPVVLKIVSPDILHKSDLGGIKLNLKNAEAVYTAFNEMMTHIANAKPDARLEGCLIEAMAPKGQELIIGMRRDSAFGPLIMFGLGGIYVELFKDVSFRVAPLNRDEALEMIHQTQAGKLLTGFRGQEKADVDAVVDVIMRLSQLAIDFPEIEEVEINPLLVLSEGKGAIALDGRVIMD